MMSDEHPELSGYEPQDGNRPLRGRRVMAIMRIEVRMPGTIRATSPNTTATKTCRLAVLNYYPYASGSDARFELSGPGGFGWQCYAVDRNEREIYLIPLGIIPSAPRAPNTSIPA
jgi:hypothetical protein